MNKQEYTINNSIGCINVHFIAWKSFLEVISYDYDTLFSMNNGLRLKRECHNCKTLVASPVGIGQNVPKQKHTLSKKYKT